MIVSSEEITNKIMGKLIKLKLLKSMEEHTQESIKIIIEETIDSDFNKIRPRTININPTIQINDTTRIKVRGDGGFHGKKNQYKIHLLEKGDEIIVDEKNQLSVHGAFHNHIKLYEPNWKFKKINDGSGEYRFKRIN